MTGCDWWGDARTAGPLGVLDRPSALEECRCWDGRRRRAAAIPAAAQSRHVPAAVAIQSSMSFLWSTTGPAVFQGMLETLPVNSDHTGETPRLRDQTTGHRLCSRPEFRDKAM